MNEETRTYTIPARFWDDHVERSNDLHALRDAEVKCTRRGVEVRLTEEQASELLSDAEHYAVGGGGFGSEYVGLMRSAQATVRRMRDAEATA